jgi:hypothetical protein
MNKKLLLEYLSECVRPDMTEKEVHTLTRAFVEVALLTEDRCTELVDAEYQFLREKKLLRDRVEPVIFNRLVTHTEVSQDTFNNMMAQLGGLIHNIARERLVTGFTVEDMESYMTLKVYQILARKLYDPERHKAISYFATAFTNLINDLNRCKNRAEVYCDSDALYTAMEIDTAEGQPYLA